MIVGDSSCGGGDPSARMGTYLKENVFVQDGKLVILARRHCAAPVDDSDLADDGENSTVGGCADPSALQYSIGRVQLKAPRQEGTSWEWGFTARMPQNAASGTRSALWLHNEHTKCSASPNADSSYAEIDVDEWYSSTGNPGESTTHGCDPATGSVSQIDKTLLPGGMNMANFHTYRVVNTTDAMGNARISYFVDGVMSAYATHRCAAPERSSSWCGTAFGEGWISIMQTAILNGSQGRMLAPSPTGEFLRQRLVISDMWVKSLTP